MRYAYYPGCSLHASAQEYDASWRAVAELLGIELVEMADWSCCGTVHADSTDRLLGLALSARNLAIAEEMELDVIAPCSGCYKSLRLAHQAVTQDGALQRRINASLPRTVQGSSAVKHPLYVILDDIGLENLGEVARPLSGLAVAPYYGCVLTRPAAETPVDDPEDPQGLDRLLQALGADVVSFPAKSKCCGGAVLLSHTDIALDLTGKLLAQAKESGAQCLAVACPMSQMALDAYQSQVERHLGYSIDLPILYFTQLVGLALGIDSRRLGLDKLFVSPTKVLSRL